MSKKVTVNGQELPLVLPYNVLMFCIEEMSEYIDSGDFRKLGAAKQTKLFSYLFGKFDPISGRIIETFDMSKIEPATAVEVLAFVQAQVMDFFTLLTARTESTLKELAEKNQLKQEELS